MTDSPSRRAPTRVRVVLLRAAAAVLAAGIIALPAVFSAATASASLGSVPSEVSAYVANGMVARLNDIYGKNAAGEGIDFTASTEAGPISRVYEWTAVRLKDQATDHPVQLTNNWVVPITIGGKAVGLATIWINPQTAAPELASFDPTPALATAMAAVPATAALVRDNATHAWLALDGGTVTPLVAGSSGLTTPAPVASLKLAAVASGAAAATTNTGLPVVTGIVALFVLLTAVALLVSRGRPPRVTRVVAPADVAGVAPEPGPLVGPETPGGSDPLAAPATPRPARMPKPPSPVTTPAGSKQGGRPPASAAASPKPRTQKPPAQKPPAAKLPAQKPPAQKPPAAKPRIQKPAAAEPPAAAVPPERPSPTTPPRKPVRKPTPRVDPDSGTERGTDIS
ncbi:MAG: hypothetical protein HIU88_02820 [Acidobacteria bacterium]|nr:hypothetical protein [Acidobacteriota bacterium]